MSSGVYALPMWLLGVLVVGAAAGLSALGVALVDRRVPVERRRSQNDIAGYISNIAAFAYAVLLAFLAVAVWQDYQSAQSTVQHEANAASDVFRQAQAYPEPLRRRVRDAIRRYVDLVIEEEWPLQARGLVSPAAWQTLADLQRDMLAFVPTDEREKAVHGEQLHDMRALLDQRRTRIFAGDQSLHPVVWMVMLAGSALIITFCWFMGTPNYRAHLAMTAILGASIGLVLFLILALDLPFRGVGIGPDAFLDIRATTLRDR